MAPKLIKSCFFCKSTSSNTPFPAGELIKLIAEKVASFPEDVLPRIDRNRCDYISVDGCPVLRVIKIQYIRCCKLPTDGGQMVNNRIPQSLPASVVHLWRYGWPTRPGNGSGSVPRQPRHRNLSECLIGHFFKSRTARKERPINRWISVSSICLPLLIGRSRKVWSRRMEYLPWPASSFC